MQLGGVVAEVPLAVGGEFAAIEADLEIVELDHAVAERAVDAELLDRRACARSDSGPRSRNSRGRRRGRAWSSRTRARRRAAAGCRYRPALFSPSERCPRRASICCACRRRPRRESPRCGCPAHGKREIEDAGLGVVDVDVVAVEGEVGVHVGEIGGLLRPIGSRTSALAMLALSIDAAAAPPAQPRDARRAPDRPAACTLCRLASRKTVTRLASSAPVGIEQQADPPRPDTAGRGAARSPPAGRPWPTSGRPKKRSQRTATTAARDRHQRAQRQSREEALQRNADTISSAVSYKLAAGSVTNSSLTATRVRRERTRRSA